MRIQSNSHPFQCKRAMVRHLGFVAASAFLVQCSALFPTDDNNDARAALLLLLSVGASSNCTPTLMGGAIQGCSRPLNLSGLVSTPAGPPQGTGTFGDIDATGNAARFSGLRGITSDGTDLYVADGSNHKIRKIGIATKVTTTFAGTKTPSGGTADGIGVDSRFNTPTDVTTDGTNLYVADQSNNKIRKIEIATAVTTTLAGPAPGSAASGDTDDTGNSARFDQPHGITTDGTNLYVADLANNKIRKIVIATGVTTTIAGPPPGNTASGDTDGTGNAARFRFPAGLTTDGTNLYVSDMGNNKIRKIVIATGVTTTLAGPAQGATTAGDADGTGNSARFNSPFNLTTDGENLYVADTDNHKIRKIVIATGVTTTIAGPAQGSTTFGDTDDTGNAARFRQPFNVTTDGTNLYIADASNNKVRKIE